MGFNSGFKGLKCRWKYLKRSQLGLPVLPKNSLLNIWYITKVVQWLSWLRHCDTSGKVEGSITDGVNGIFGGHTPNLSGPHYGPGVDSASNKNK